ncbi:MAG: hypothetical protein KAI29_06075, partial [Cyclobacteriaceae bacterium]|nr:hypothetical protein [Cyclobacteriaceae bacterium]
MKYHLLFSLMVVTLFIHLVHDAHSQVRQEISFNDQWNFQGQSVSGLQINEIVGLPHSWNTTDAQEGIPYYRGTGKYEKYFDAEDSWKNHRVFIRFEGVNIIAKVRMNDKELGEHKGGYAAFIFEITDHLLFDERNIIEVIVSNEANLEVIPLVGDFNNYGGIYRPVNLIVTGPICITPMDYASPGIYLIQKNVNKENAEVEVLTKISNNSGMDAEITYSTSIINADGVVVEDIQSNEQVSKGSNELRHKYIIKKLHLWNGKKDPYLY